MPLSKATASSIAPAAKGDLVVGSATNDAAVLAVGSSGESLVVDSSTTTGLRYTAGNAQGNPVLNSAMQIWQRGTSFALSTNVITYTADRWSCIRGATGATISRQVTGDTTNLPFIQYSTRVQRDSGNTSTALIQLTQSLESSNSIFYSGKTVTFSFYARAGANFSAASSALVAVILTGTGTDQNLINGFTGVAQPLGGGVTLTTTWQRFTFTGTISTSATQVGIQFYFTPTGTAGANDWAEITGVQIDVGSVALPFRTYAATLAGELAACQRYYYVVASGLDKFVSWSAYYTSTAVAGSVPFKVSMRTTPTLVATTITDGYKISANSDFFTTLNLSSVSNSESGYIFADTNVSGTTGYASYIQTANSGTSVAFNAEL